MFHLLWILWFYNYLILFQTQFSWNCLKEIKNEMCPMCIFHKIAQELEVTKQGNQQLVRDAPTRMFVLPNRRDQTRVIMDVYT